METLRLPQLVWVLTHEFRRTLKRFFVAIPCVWLPKNSYHHSCQNKFKTFPKWLHIMVSVCCCFHETGWKSEVHEHWLANLSRLPAGQLGGLLLKAQSPDLTLPCPSPTRNGAPKSGLFQDIFTGKNFRYQQSFLTEMDFLL